MIVDIPEMQKLAYLEGRARYKARTGIDADAPVTTADTSSNATKLQKVIDDFRRKYPDGVETVPQCEPGPLVREAEQMAEALRRAVRGDIGEASANHKLPPFITYG